MALYLIIGGIDVALKKDFFIEYVLDNRIFTDADNYSLEIELLLADSTQNNAIIGIIIRMGVDSGDIFFDKVFLVE